MYAMPPIVAAACRFLIGAGPWQIPIILSAFVAQSLIGNAVALRAGGELVPPVERWRRGVARIAARPPMSSFLWTFLFFLLLLLSLLLPMAEEPNVSRDLGFAALISVGGSLVSSGLCLFILRAQARQIESTDAPPVQQSPWTWLRHSTPLRGICIAGIVLGYFAARFFPWPVSLLFLWGGMLLGQVVETLTRARWAKKGPVLWNNFGFGAMLAAGAVQLGVPFALFFGLMERLTVGSFDLATAVFAVAGFAGGVLYIFVIWGLARLNSVKAKAAGSRE